ncbi:hypothetical protein B0H11DRAFT_2236235 [Mycena galericulata]|nr:hypothetical protein B0H11DRAFT_2236235 [Mycena galericulata]
MYSSMKSALITLAAVATTVARVDAVPPPAHSRNELSQRDGGHPFTLVNKCSTPVTPIIADTSCGYSPRCGAGVADYSGPQPTTLAPQGSQTLTIDTAWVGRIFASHPACGPKGEDCTITEYNLDSGSFFTPQTYDISNIRGFTDSVQIAVAGCDTVTCTSPSCGCTNAYPIGDTTGCGDDAPVHACGAGPIAFTVTFCP